MKELTFFGILSIINLIGLSMAENIVIIIMDFIAFAMSFVMFIYYYFSNE